MHLLRCIAKMVHAPPEVFLAGRHGIFQKIGQKLISSDAPPEVHLAGRLKKFFADAPPEVFLAGKDRLTIWRGKVNLSKLLLS